MTFSEKLYKLRKHKGLSQEQLAERLAVSRQAISKWESGTAMPESEKLLVISRFFGVSLDYLMKDELEDEDCSLEKSKNNGTDDVISRDQNIKSINLVGFVICTAGFLGLLLWGIIMIFNPEASSQLSTSSAIHIDGNGIFLIFCVSVIAAGAGLLLRRPGNGAKNEKNK